MPFFRRAWPWLFVIVPLVETYLLSVFARATSFGATILMILVTGIIGAALAKQEGIRVWRQYQAAIRAGRLPEEGLFSGLLILAGGILLMAPGVLTDIVGVLLLVPPTRAVAVRFLKRQLKTTRSVSGASPAGWDRLDAKRAQRETDADTEPLESKTPPKP